MGYDCASRSPCSVVVCIAVFGYGDVGKDCALALLGLVLVFIAVFGYGDVGKYCALALLGSVLVFISVVAQKQGLLIQLTIEIVQLQPIDKVFDVSVVQGNDRCTVAVQRQGDRRFGVQFG